MENSFYYFFSATPQVLGGILALFGVFVIFKLQTLTTELISIASEIVEFIQDCSKINLTDNDIKNIDGSLHSIETYIKTKNVTLLKYALDSIDDSRLATNDYYKNRKENYDSLFTTHKSLKNQTIQSSTFTAIIIIICLGIIPFGKWLICYPVILYIIFGIVIICIGISFYKLISVLTKSFN